MRIRVYILVCTWIVIQGCQLRPNPDELVRGVLADFVYVGSAATANASDVPSHATKSEPLPQHFVSHRAYVFHRRNTDGTAPVWQILEKRMQACGIRVLAAPRGTNGLVYSYVGGPFFSIDFQIGNRRGVIQSQLDGAILNDPELSRAWKDEDYILRFDN